MTDADVREVQAAGYDDAQVVEIALHVALNTLTNDVNTALGTDVDFGSVKPRAAYARMERAAGWETTITDDLAAFLSQQDSFFFAPANAAGQPYIQHRGGPRGFVQVLDEKTLAFADSRGNKQYISVGNLAENPRVHLFFIDCAEARRIKVWGEAKVVEDDPALVSRLRVPGEKGVPERAIVVRVSAWDANCPQHIPRKVDLADVARAIEARDARIEALEREVKALKSASRAR